MAVTTVSLIDTDSDPDVVDLPIPGNDDDSIRSIELILEEARVDDDHRRQGVDPAGTAAAQPPGGCTASAARHRGRGRHADEPVTNSNE